MDYDSRRYKQLFKQGKMHRIMNIVLNFDKSFKKNPSCLLDMFKTSNSVVDKHFFNYGFTSLNIYEIAENYDKFSCEELQQVLYLFKCDREKRPLMEDLENGTLKGIMSRDAALVCAVFLGMKMEIEDNSEEIDMCKAVRDMKKRCADMGREEGRAEGRAEGRVEGRAEGREEGREEGFKLGMEKTRRDIVERLRNMNLDVHDICHLLGISEETVRQIELSLQG
jgi:hypothetical protein